MTPPRLVELKCPACGRSHWVIDSDFRGTFPGECGPDAYEQREYACPHCNYKGDGHVVLRQSPPELFLQPHDMYPMSQDDFDHWLGILKTHFPDYPHLQRVGRSWRPRLPRPLALVSGKRLPQGRVIDLEVWRQTGGFLLLWAERSCTGAKQGVWERRVPTGGMLQGGPGSESVGEKFFAFTRGTERARYGGAVTYAAEMFGVEPSEWCDPGSDYEGKAPPADWSPNPALNPTSLRPAG